MKKNPTVIIVCFLVICLLASAYCVVKAFLSSRTKLTSFVIGQTKQINYNTERCNMSDNQKISDTVFESDYETLLKELRDKYKQKLTALRDEFNEKLKKSAYEALGSEFAMLISERVILLKDFEQITKKMLLEGGLSSNNEKLIALNNWAKQGDKKDKVLGKSLFKTVIEEVSKINPELGEKTKKAEIALEQNHKQLEECIENNRSSGKMKEIENATRAEMKKDIVKLILEYNIELKKLRQQFNLPATKLESPFDTNEAQEKGENSLSDPSNIEVDNVFGDDLFIAKKKNNDDLN